MRRRAGDELPCRHQLRAERERLARRGQIGLDHVAEVMTGAEDRSLGGEQPAASVRSRRPAARRQATRACDPGFADKPDVGLPFDSVMIGG
jgi:hypothetical protein